MKSSVSKLLLRPSVKLNRGYSTEKFSPEILENLSVEVRESFEEDTRTIPMEMNRRFSQKFNVGRNHLGASTVPDAIQSALNRVLKGYPRRQLRHDASNLAESYAKMTKVSAEALLDSNFETSSAWSEADRQALVEFSAPAVEYGPRETFAYIASQLPFMLAPLQNVFGELARRIPAFAPKSMLDFGSGPGTAIIAAQKHWNASLQDIMAVDVSQSMLEMGAELFKELAGNVVKWRQYMAMNPQTRPKYDLVVASMVLSELADDSLRGQTVDHLWQQTNDVLVLIDRGNPEGFRILRSARDKLIELSNKNDDASSKMHIVAPVKRIFKHALFPFIRISFSVHTS